MSNNLAAFIVVEGIQKTPRAALIDFIKDKFTIQAIPVKVISFDDDNLFRKIVTEDMFKETLLTAKLKNLNVIQKEIASFAMIDMFLSNLFCNVLQHILPALRRGEVVIMDTYINSLVATLGLTDRKKDYIKSNWEVKIQTLQDIIRQPDYLIYCPPLGKQGVENNETNQIIYYPDDIELQKLLDRHYDANLDYPGVINYTFRLNNFKDILAMIANISHSFNMIERRRLVN